ncbi:MAG TPA: DUF4410 domain-containing protein [Terriglobia bacterium]|nr:DUF4410 domain-containing protein [Terriglobia bacterium]
MMKRIVLVFFVVVSVLLAAGPVRAAQATVRDKYRVVQVDRFEVAEGVNFPAEYLLVLQEDIVRQLQKSKTFDEVLRPGESPANPSAAVLRLSGTITGFTSGSRGKRYIGLGMGQTKIFARLAYSDRATSQALIVEQVQGVLMGGFMGGKSSNVTREFAKTVATNSKVVLGKQLPAPGEAVAAPPALNVPAGNAERQVIAFSSKDFEGSEKKLNDEAAKGFRLVGFALTGKDSASLTLEKTEAAAQPSEYRIVHARLAGSLQKKLNTAAAEGFRLTPHTLGQFGATLAVITQKVGSGGTSACQYRVHVTMRVSSLQHDIEKDQAEGYKLADTWEYSTSGHLAILEKSSD